jgi:hypothetical protein
MKLKTLQKKYGKVTEVEIKDGPKKGLLINKKAEFDFRFFLSFLLSAAC